ncbi:hypothetical protein FQN54_006473 [Arachnomyces sp. PD_36]|nr:hypothetical protein FQN54_006473 [Arachnomyces sp. PD_36]
MGPSREATKSTAVGGLPAGGMPTGANYRTIVYTVPLLKLSYASTMMFYLGILLPRFSMAAFYFTLFPEGMKLRKALYAVTVYMGLCVITIVLVMTCYCIPISLNWSMTSQCYAISAPPPFTLFWVITMVCDVALFALPFFLFPKLSLRAAQRFALVGVFLVGAITIIVSIARYISIKATKDLGTICIWSVAEFACSIIVVCLPSLKVFFHGAINSLRQTDNSYPETDSRPKKRTWPFFSFSDQGSTIRENGTTLSTRFSSIVDQFISRQSEPTTMSIPRAAADSPIIPSFKDVGHLLDGENGNDISQIELSSMDSQQQNRRPSEFQIYKTNDLQFDVHIHNRNGANSCEPHGSSSNSYNQNSSPPCTTVEYFPGGKTPFETKIWV